MSTVLFIDANQYLALYGLADGKKLLDLLEKQNSYIFVSSQIVDEVHRNKLQCAQKFFSDKFKEIEEVYAAVPDHLLGISEEKIKEFRDIFDRAKKLRNDLTEHGAAALLQISRSEDLVSKRLNTLFDGAILHNIDQMDCARERKERGNPPGKPNDPLGDQITWEQLLTYCGEGKSKRLWIITGDADYLTKFGKHSLFLNSFLHQELTTACGAALEVRCFNNLMKGIIDFDKEAGAKVAESVLTAQESMAIEQELEALPPMPGAEDTTRKASLLRSAIKLSVATGDFSFLVEPAILEALRLISSGVKRLKQ